MNVNVMWMEQFELARVLSLRDMYKAKAPMLWDLLFHLLNSDSRTHKMWTAIPALSTPMKVISTPDISDFIRGDNPIANDQIELYDIVCETCYSSINPYLQPSERSCYHINPNSQFK